MSSNLPYITVDVTPEAEPHWKALAEGKMLVQWDTKNDTWVWPPKALAPWDPEAPLEWRELSGEGEVYTFTIIHKGGALGGGVDFNINGPYVLAYITLDGGPTIMGNVVGDDALEVKIGDRVKLIAPPEPVEQGAARFVRV